jgi:hypothetical protein
LGTPTAPVLNVCALLLHEKEQPDKKKLKVQKKATLEEERHWGILGRLGPLTSKLI